MGIGIDLKGIGDILGGAGTLAKDIRSAVTGEIAPEKKAELALKAQEIDAKLATVQGEINKIEASSTNWFIAGARPSIMWICAAGLFYGTIGKPFMEFIARLFGYQGEFPAIDNATLNTTMLGMLGLGTMRTVEKMNNATGNH